MSAKDWTVLAGILCATHSWSEWTFQGNRRMKVICSGFFGFGSNVGKGAAFLLLFADCAALLGQKEACGWWWLVVSGMARSENIKSTLDN